MSYYLQKLRRELRKALLDITPPVIARARNRGRIDSRDLSGTLMEMYRQRVMIDRDAIDWIEYVQRSPVLAIPIARARYAGGVSYLHDDHPMRRFYRRGMDGLATYYAGHHPRDVFERTFLPSPRPNPANIMVPWVAGASAADAAPDAGDMGLAARLHGVQQFGPVSPEKLKLEAARLERIRAALARDGYLPRHGFPTGYFLVGEDGDWAMHVHKGQHRVAAMADLGYTEMPVQMSPTRKRVIRLSESARWPGVRDGRMSEAEAREIFTCYLVSARDLHFADPTGRTRSPDDLPRR